VAEDPRYGWGDRRVHQEEREPAQDQGIGARSARRRCRYTTRMGSASR
jgi:hypothetical protein